MFRLYRRNNKTLLEAVRVSNGNMTDIANAIDALRSKYNTSTFFIPKTTVKFVSGKPVLIIHNSNNITAHCGDWVVRDEHGAITVLDNDKFTQNHTPQSTRGY